MFGQRYCANDVYVDHEVMSRVTCMLCEDIVFHVALSSSVSMSFVSSCHCLF